MAENDSIIIVVIEQEKSKMCLKANKINERNVIKYKNFRLKIRWSIILTDYWN